MAHAHNGYIYHTKYDNFQNLERGTYQSTGDNVLALTWALANAEELKNPDEHAGGNTVYYDFLGWFLIRYSGTAAIVINTVVGVAATILVDFSVYIMTKEIQKTKKESQTKIVFFTFIAILIVQGFAIIAAAGLTVLIAVIVDAMGLTLSWYSEKWLIFGLYFCPIFFALTMIPALFMKIAKKWVSF